MWTFQTKDDPNIIEIPYLEDARADYAPYYSAARGSVSDHKKFLNKARDEVIENLSKLGGGLAGFQEVIFTDEKSREREGYNIYYFYGNGRGVIRAAGLPMKGEKTEKKILKAQTQALLIVRDWLKSAVTAQVFSPGFYALVPFMLVDEHHTVTDKIMINGNLPRLNSPEDSSG